MKQYLPRIIFLTESGFASKKAHVIQWTSLGRLFIPKNVPFTDHSGSVLQSMIFLTSYLPGLTAACGITYLEEEEEVCEVHK